MSTRQDRTKANLYSIHFQTNPTNPSVNNEHLTHEKNRQVEIDMRDKLIARKLDRIEIRKKPLIKPELQKKKFIQYNFTDAREKRFWEEMQGMRLMHKQH